MSDAAQKSRVRWPNVPDVYGWLALDARGEWRLRNPASGRMEGVGNATFRQYIASHYGADARGAWFLQNGPQRVFVRIERTPLVFRLGPMGLYDHCGRSAAMLRGVWLDERGALVLAGEHGVGVLDDRDFGEACAHIVDGRGAVLDEAGLTALMEAGRATGQAYFAFDGDRIAVEYIGGADLGSRFGFIPDPAP